MYLSKIGKHKYYIYGTNSKFFFYFRPQLSVASAALLAPVLLAVSMLMATPIFFHTRLHDFNIHNDDGIID